jgi:ornithine cyclodeaminase
MIYIDADQVNSALDYNVLIDKLHDGFILDDLGIPKRHHHNYPNPPGKESTLLLMPAWQEGQNVGVKIVNVTPENGKHGMPSIHGIYLYFDAKTGIPKALMDSNMITKKRTAATSALASIFLSRKDSSSMLMVGTGALAPELIVAHCQVRDIRTVQVWGRDFSKAQKIANDLQINGVEIIPIDNLEAAVTESDIISTATLSKDPLIHGEWLQEGQHIDLVGSYKPDMREADDTVIGRSSIFVDTYEGAPYESGDLALPIAEDLISIQDIKADLFELCRKQNEGRASSEEITCFKSVGHALEDLVAAQLVFDVYEKSVENEQ